MADKKFKLITEEKSNVLKLPLDDDHIINRINTLCELLRSTENDYTHEVLLALIDHLYQYEWDQNLENCYSCINLALMWYENYNRS